MEQEKYNPEGGLVVGCAGCLVEAIIALVFLLAMASCSSYKEVCGITQEYLDSLYAAQAHMDVVVNQQNDSTYSSFTTATTDSSTTVAESDLDEVINEHIVETTDSLGNKTTTTDRTIKRKQNDKQTNKNVSTLQQSGVGESISNHQENTLSADYDKLVQGHWEKTDSISEKPIEGKKDNRPWWQKILDCLKYFMVGAFLGIAGTMLYKAIKQIIKNSH